MKTDDTGQAAASLSPDALSAIEDLAGYARQSGRDEIEQLLSDMLAILHGWPSSGICALHIDRRDEEPRRAASGPR